MGLSACNPVRACGRNQVSRNSLSLGCVHLFVPTLRGLHSICFSLSMKRYPSVGVTLASSICLCGWNCESYTVTATRSADWRPIIGACCMYVSHRSGSSLPYQVGMKQGPLGKHL